MNKPNKLVFKDIEVEPRSEDYDDMGGGAFCVQIDGTVYSAKDMRRVIRRLERCREWLLQKEKYL